MKQKSFSLENKTAIVTGAIGLLGRQHCFALYEAGANVVVVDLEYEQCKAFAKELGEKAIGIKCDITLKEDLINLLEQTLIKFDNVDILVNNAAINDMVENPISLLEDSKFENFPFDLFRKVLDINITGMFLSCQVIGSYMAKKVNGSIINIASTYGIVAPNQSLYQDSEGNQILYKSPAYPTTKGAVISFTKFLAAYWGSKGVRVNSLSPGGVRNNQSEHFIEKYSERTPLKRMAEPEDYRGALVFLASNASSYMTGANLVVDGGWTIW